MTATKHGAWLPYLEKCGIDRFRATEWMRLAGRVDEKCAASPNVEHLPAPTLADAGIDKRPRKRDEAILLLVVRRRVAVVRGRFWWSCRGLLRVVGSTTCTCGVTP